MPRPKTKDDRIHIKTTHEIKEQVFINAEMEHRTLSSYIENLILQDSKKKNVD